MGPKFLIWGKNSSFFVLFKSSDLPIPEIFCNSQLFALRYPLQSTVCSTGITLEKIFLEIRLTSNFLKLLEFLCFMGILQPAGDSIARRGNAPLLVLKPTVRNFFLESSSYTSRPLYSTLEQNCR